MTFDIDIKMLKGVKFLNPLRLKGKSVIGVILAWSVDGHDDDIFCSMVRLKCLATGLSRLCLVFLQCSKILVFRVRLVSPMYCKPHLLQLSGTQHWLRGSEDGA